MATFQIGGIASGLDTHEIIEKLMALERQPVVRLEQRQVELQAKKEAWQSVRNRLTNLLNKVGDLRTSGTFTGKVVTSGNEGVVTATASAGAVNGTYSVEVLQLAQPQRNISGQHGDIDAPLGIEGDLHINGVEIEIDGADTLLTVMNKINNSEGGIRASLVDGHLILTGVDTGSFDLEDSQGGSILTGLKLTAEEGMEVGAAQEAQVSIEGKLITSETNTLKDIIPGVTINLHGEAATTITVSQDSEKALKAVKAFVAEYNSTFDFLASQLRYNADAEEAGVLFGETALMQIQSRLRQKVGSPVEGLPDGLQMLSQVGITTGRVGAGVTATGRLELDEARFLAALEEDPEGVAALFKGVGDVLKEDLETFTRSTTGIISGREQAAQRRIDDLRRQVVNMERRLEIREESLVRQFTALERAMGQMNNQSAWLNNQLNQLAGNWGGQ